MNPCLLGQDKCDQLCFWKSPSKSPYEDEIVKTLGRNRIMQNLPTTGWDDWMSSYTCGCVPGYTMDPNTKRCKPDISNQRYDLLFLTSVEGTLHIQSAGTVQSENDQRVYLGEEHVIKRKDNTKETKTIRAFASDIRNGFPIYILIFNIIFNKYLIYLSSYSVHFCASELIRPFVT